MLFLVAASLAAASPARANGDPASDVLPFEDVFVSGYALPTTSDLSAAQVQQLKQTVREAKTSGFRIKVALIGQPGDLGLVTQLWQQPQRYADFLGQELASFGNYHNRLLVVMPNGYGIYSDRGPTERDKRVVATLRPTGTRDDLPLAATHAVTRLAKASGTHVAVPPLQQRAESNSGRHYSIIARVALSAAAAITVLALILGGFVACQRVRSRRYNG